MPERNISYLGMIVLGMSVACCNFRFLRRFSLSLGSGFPSQFLGVCIGDYWDDDLMDKHVNVKEMFAVSKALESLPCDVRDCRGMVWAWFAFARVNSSGKTYPRFGHTTENFFGFVFCTFQVQSSFSSSRGVLNCPL